MNPWLTGRVLFPLHEWLKRKPTFRRLGELERTQWLSADRIAELQMERLRGLLEWATTHVPYYRSVLAERGLRPRDIVAIHDLARLPFLTRELVQTRFDDLRARAALRGVHRRSSGGSTGVPVTVLVDMDRMGMQEGARLRAHRWFGLEPGAREVVLWGSPIEVTRQDRVRGLRDWLLNSRLLSAFDMGEVELGEHAAEIRRFRPAKLYGYASALHLLAAHMDQRRLPAPAGLRAVFATAEPLFDFQRETIERAFGCPAAVEYGCRDGGLVALECPRGGLHIAAEGMVVEIVDPEVDGRGEIVLTNLDSHAFPIVRYRTGDIGSLDPDPCPCGRGLPRLRGVEGRQTDFLVTPEGRMLHALSAIYILRDSPAVREFRVVQETIDHLTVEIVPARSLLDFASESGHSALETRFRALMGPGVDVDVRPVSRIPRTASGKFRYVESKVGQEQLARLTASGPRDDPRGV